MFSKVDLESWDLRKFAGTTIFYEIYNMCHLQSNLETCKKKLWKKDSECKYCKDISKIKIQCFLCIFGAFAFQPLSKGYCSSNSWFVTCYCLKMAPKLVKYQNLLRTKKYLQMDSRWCMICISWKLFVLAKFLKSQQFKTIFKKNPSCIFLSLRANSKKTVCYDGPCNSKHKDFINLYFNPTQKI